MYPFVMLNNPFPVRLVAYIPHPELSTLKWTMQHYLVLARVKVKITKPCIAVKLDKLIFPIGTFRVVLTSPELELVEQYGKILEVEELAIYESAYLFRCFVEEIYGVKQKADAEGNRSVRLFSKLLLNSLYGKFGQKREIREKVEGYEWLGEGTHHIYSHEEQKYMYVYNFCGESYVVRGFEEPLNSFPAISSYTSAYARCYLWKLLEKAGEHNVYYCDTDSLFVNEQGYRNLQSYIKPGELGYLKLEGIENGMMLRGAKDYKIGDMEKIKGIKKSAVRVGENTFLQKIFTRTKTLMRLGILRGVVEREQKKVLKREYDKGVVSATGWVSPHVLTQH
jgi:hypothetical protein